jgi:hypothetical protein
MSAQLAQNLHIVYFAVAGAWVLLSFLHRSVYPRLPLLLSHGQSLVLGSFHGEVLRLGHVESVLVLLDYLLESCSLVCCISAEGSDVLVWSELRNIDGIVCHWIGFLAFMEFDFFEDS